MSAELAPRGNIFSGPKSLSIQPTFQCNAACTDCGTFSSPHEKASISLESIIAAIDEAKELGFFNVVFTGGEATLRWDDLIAGIAHATSLDFPTRVVTNGFWAWTVEKAAAKIDILMAAGLKEINFSTGDEHVKFVPIDRVVNGVLAALDRQLPVHVMVELRAQRHVTKDVLFAQPRISALPDDVKARIGVSESPWMPIDPSRVEKYPAGTAIDSTNISSATGCDSILQTYTLQGDGRIGCCCGLGLRLLPELNVAHAAEPGFLRRAVTEAESDLLKLWIRYVGAERVLAWAAEKNPEIQWEGMYAHRCQACMRIYHDPLVAEAILEHHEEMLATILQNMWLDQEYLPSQLGNVFAGPGAPSRFTLGDTRAQDAEEPAALAAIAAD